MTPQASPTTQASPEPRRAFVAGGTAGIGLAVAGALVADGFAVTIGGRRNDGPDVARAAGCKHVPLAIADEASVQAAFAAAAGPLDVVVLNAGAAQPPVPTTALDSGTARAVVDTNLLGTFFGLKHAPAAMADGGSIIVTSSISALMGTPFEGLYGATKAATGALVRSGAIDLGPRGIRVNAVAPGPTWTDMNPMPERLLEILAPLGRKGRVDDLAGVFSFLASDASSYVTGQVIVVDGGVTAGVSQALLGVLGKELTA